MSRTTATTLALVMLGLFLAARVFDLDLGGFGIALLFAAAGFGLKAIVTPRLENPHG